MKEKIQLQLQLCGAEFLAILSLYHGAVDDGSTAEVLMVSNTDSFFMIPAIIDKTLLKQWSSYTKRPSVSDWQPTPEAELRYKSRRSSLAAELDLNADHENRWEC